MHNGKIAESGFTPTREQEDIVKMAGESTANIIVSALAGAAKTSTIDLICRALPTTPILCLAFNKRIAQEMTKRLPGNATSRTLNSIGHIIWANTVGRPLTLDADKSYNLIRHYIKNLPRENRPDISEMSELCRKAKQLGYAPLYSKNSLLTQEEFVAELDIIPHPSGLDLLDRVLEQSIKLAFTGNIDFDDQLYMPVLHGARFPKYPLVIIDEAQDLSFINHKFLVRLTPQRLIAVGDPHQSIYGFRGALTDSMNRLKKDFSLVEMPLTTSFRCAKAIVAEVLHHVPQMKWAPGAPEGEVETLDVWSVESVPDGAAVICRNNAPLIRCAMKFIRVGRPVKLTGTDTGQKLLKILQKLGPDTMGQSEAFIAVDLWESAQLSKSKVPASVTDQADCLRTFIANSSTLGGAVAYAKTLFQAEGSIHFLTGHKAKGLEWGTVYHLDPQLIPISHATTSEELRQEYNLQYVISTRAKHTLRCVKTSNLSL